MGTMALGYGSEFHLLRWLGRHRAEFDKRVKAELKVDNITWLDFEFDAGKKIPDQELKGISFLKGEPSFSLVSSMWQSEWPQSGNSMNWDLIGYTVKDGIKCWVLVEAKAHLSELKQRCGASSSTSLDLIEKALSKAARNNGITISPSKPWIEEYYQLANRIYILDLLKRNGIDAKLLNIYFVGDVSDKTRNSPKLAADWTPDLIKMKNYLGITSSSALGIYDLFLNVDK